MVSSIDIKKVSSRDKVVVDVEQFEVAQIERVVEVDRLGLRWSQSDLKLMVWTAEGMTLAPSEAESLVNWIFSGGKRGYLVTWLLGRICEVLIVNYYVVGR